MDQIKYFLYPLRGKDFYKMKRIAIIGMCFIFIVSVVFLSTVNSGAQDVDFSVTNINPNWEWQYFKTLEFSTAAISFDSRGNLYATDIIGDWGPGEKKIIKFEAPAYDEQSIFLTYETDYHGISGMDFDCAGSLYVSEIMGRNSGSDVGAIRKINTRRYKVSDPIDFINVGLDGDFRPTGLAATGFGKLYFPGRKWSDPEWGNIYQITSFNRYDPRTGPKIHLDAAIWTAIAMDKWGNIFYSVSTSDPTHTPNSVFTLNPYTKEEVWVASFNQYIEELSFDRERNLHVLEGAEEDVSTIIMLEPPYILIDGCDTGIIDWPLPDGSTISELIENCAETTDDHKQFVDCVARDTSHLVKNGILGIREMISILFCSVKADIP